MKAFKPAFLTMTILIISMVFNSCQKDETSITGPEPSAKILKEGLPDCSTACLQNGPFEQNKTSFVRSWSPLNRFPGFYRNNKYFATKAWNDESNFYVEITSDGDIYDQKRINGTWVLTGPEKYAYPFSEAWITLDGTTHQFTFDPPVTSYTYTVALPAGWEACDEMAYSVKLFGEGPPVWLGNNAQQSTFVYNLYDNCPANLFAGDITCGFGNALATFIFTPGQDFSFITIQGSVIQPSPFPDPHAVTSVGLETGGPFVIIGSWIGSDYMIEVPGGPVQAGVPVAVSVFWFPASPAVIATGTWTVTDSNGTLLGTVDPMSCQ